MNVTYFTYYVLMIFNLFLAYLISLHMWVRNMGHYNSLN